MAQFGKNLDIFSASRTVNISGYETESKENFTLYVIEVSMGQFCWTVKHRYSEFHEMHEKLVAEHKIDKNILPPKKIFGKMSDGFIRQRRADLEIYIQTVLHKLNFTIPPVLASFLNFQKYEIHGITECLAELLFTKGDQMLQSKDVFTLTPLQLYSINERLKLAEPTCESGDKKKDIGHILDFVTLNPKLRIIGSRDPVGTSNIDMNMLEFDMTIFRNLEFLEIKNCNPSMMCGIDVLKRTIKSLSVKHSLKSLQDILMQDVVNMPVAGHGYLVSFWLFLRFADFSHNDISVIDESVKLIPKTEVMKLSHNHIENLNNLSHLSALVYLDLSHNKLKDLNAVHVKLGNVKKLNLAGNQISSLQGLSKLYSLEVLDLSSNDISKVLEITHISRLPCLEKLFLVGNPVTAVLDYRTKVFEMFGDRAPEVNLDNLRASQKELDTVAILQAIQKARQGREKIRKPKKNAHTVSIADLEGNMTHAGSVNAAKMTEELQTNEAEYFRLQVETIRAQGGEGWLTLLNDMQITEEQLDRNSSDPKERSVSAISAQSFLRSDMLQVHTDENLSSCAHLPGTTDRDFMNHVMLLISSLNIQSEIPGITSSVYDKSEQIIFILWCQCFAFHKGRPSFPGCVVVTNEMIHIFLLKTLGKYPDIAHVYSISINNIQEVVIGNQHSYVRVEESFMGAQGTFSFCPCESYQVEQLISHLRNLCRITDQDVLVLIDYSDIAYKRLLAELQKYEGQKKVEYIYSAHVQVPGKRSALLENGSFLHAAVITFNNLFLVQEDVVHFPRPTFELNASNEHRCQFRIMQVYSLINTVKDVQFTNKTPDLDEGAKTMVYGLKLFFESPSMQAQANVDVTTLCKFHCVFSSPEKRDLFLYQLMQVRRELIPRTVKSLSASEQQELESEDLADSIFPLNLDGQSLDDNGAANESNISETTLDEEFWETAEEEDDTVEATSTAVNKISAMSEKTAENTADYEQIHSETLAGSQSSGYFNNDHDGQCMFPQSDLLHALNEQINNTESVRDLSENMIILSKKSGEGIFNYFYNNVSLNGIENEELRFVMWTPVVLYCNPDNEVPSCVFLSTKAIYFVSDLLESVKECGTQSWQKHHRNKSDSLLHTNNQEDNLPFPKSLENSLRSNEMSSDKVTHDKIHRYAALTLKQLKHVHIGLFDQFLRLAGADGNQVFTCLTRNFYLTETFMRQLMSVLLKYPQTSSSDYSSSDSEPDFYKLYSHSDPVNSEIQHRSKVKIMYTSDENATELCFLIHKKLQINVENPLKLSFNVLSYLLVFQIDASQAITRKVCGLKPRSIVLTDSHISLALEDCVHYPLLDFVRCPPEQQQFKICDVRRLDYLQRIVVSDFTSNDITFVFFDHEDSVVVDIDKDHFCKDGRRDTPGFVHWTILVPSILDKDKFLKLVSKLWSDCHAGLEISIQVST